MARIFDRRDVLKGTGALALTVAAAPLRPRRRRRLRSTTH